MRNVFCSLLFVAASGAGGAACMASGTAHYSASATMPSLVYISPGVQVIEDYDEPVFYSSNVYWRYNGGIWYQSRTYTGGWVRVTAPPAVIVRIQQPAMYVHYRASARGGAQANANATAVHEERREEKQERREDKQERREDKQERREDKQEHHDERHDNGNHGNKK